MTNCSLLHYNRWGKCVIQTILYIEDFKTKVVDKGEEKLHKYFGKKRRKILKADCLVGYKLIIVHY